MYKEFIPYEQALALKELGFDEPCIGYYESTYGKDKVIIDNSGLITNTNFSKVFNETRFRLVTPTFSQAFRWFREKHGIVFYLNMVGINLYYYVIGTEPFLSSKTYEEAELACLIKLIEIVKQKQ